MNTTRSIRRRLSRVTRVFVFAPVVWLAVSGQARDIAVPPPQAGSAVISGVVIDESGRPLNHVIVRGAARDQATVETVSDVGGQFVMDRLPAGRYTVTARKPAFLVATYGATRIAGPGQVLTGTPVSVKDGERITNLILKMRRGGVISGHILDAQGQPARGIAVTAGYIKRSHGSGKPTLEMVSDQELGASVLTDSAGNYRLYGLPPGAYVLSASIAGIPETATFRVTTSADVERALASAQSSGAQRDSGPASPAGTAGYSAIYYPGTPVAAEAQPVAVAAGLESSGRDFELQLVPIARVRGTILGIDGRPAPGVTATISVPARSGGTFMKEGTSDAQGRFSIEGVPPGAYQVEVQANQDPPVWASADVTVSGQDVATELRLRAAVSVSGHVTLSSDSPAERDRLRIVVDLWPAVDNVRGDEKGTQVDATSGFTLRGVVPDRYLVRAGVLDASGRALDSAWSVQSVVVAGQEVLGKSVELGTNGDVTDVTITLTHSTTLLTGKVLTAAGQPAPDYVLIAFSTDSSLWLSQSPSIQIARPQSDGSYRFEGLPPGRYYLAAATDVEDGEWFDPAFLRTLMSQAITIPLAKGEQRIFDIRAR